MTPTPPLPWEPLYSTLRSGQIENTVYGIVYAGSHTKQVTAQAGNIHYPLWGRSLLKPWQLMVIFPVLKQAYPQLQDQHFALMMASQQSDPEQWETLQALLKIGALSEDMLQCPACSAMKESNRALVDIKHSPLHHPCGGKHLGYLLAFKALKQSTEDYLNPQQQPYVLLRKLLSHVLGRDFLHAPETTDGCGMPNMALSAQELAQLYHWLATKLPEHFIQNAPDELLPILNAWNEVGRIMRQHPEMVGGQGRLDTRLIQGQWLKEANIPPVQIAAKEGADGLLAVGIGATSQAPDGLGILIKVSSGYEPSHLQTLVFALLREFNLSQPRPRKIDPHVQTRLEFNTIPEALNTISGNF